MAFGDEVQTPKSANAYPATSNPVPITAATAGSLLICVAFTGAGSITLPSGFTSAVTIRDNPNSDDAEISYKIAAGGETEVAPGSTTSDEHVACVLEIEGPWEASPLDVVASTAAASGSSTSSGTTAATAQNDEFAVAAITSRTYQTAYSAWTNSFTERDEEWSSYKSVGTATKVLTSTGTVETTATHTSGTAMGLIATFKKAAAAAAVAPQSTHVSQAVQRAATW